jgi:hypothetical protein
MSISYIYERFEHLLRFWMGIWLYIHLDTTTDTSPDCESWLKSYLIQVCKPCQYALVEAVEPFKLHPMSMAYIYEVFELILRMWMGIWFHTHTVTTTGASPDLERLAEIHLMQVCKLYPYALVEAVKPFNWHPLSMT